MARSLARTGVVVLCAACANAPGGQAAGALGVRAADSGQEASIITVTDVAQLKSALASAHGGETIRLAPGAYTGLGRLTGLNYASRLTITSADASQPAVVMPFWVVKSSNIAFTHIEFSGAGSADPHLFRVYASTNIAFDHDSFRGDMDGPPSADPSSGVSFFSSANISVTNSDFTHLYAGIGVGTTSGAVVRNNSFHQMRCDGIDVASSVSIVIENNVFTDFHPATGDHPDAIQLWGGGSSDNTISGNLYVRGAGAPIQGVFGGYDPPFAKNVTISNNIIVGGGYSGIAISNAENFAVLSNTVAAYPDMDSWVRLQNNGGGGRVADNVSFHYLYANNLKISQERNRTTNYVSDHGKALVTQWLAAHPGWTGTFPASLLDLVGATPTPTASGRAGAPLPRDPRHGSDVHVS
jgi:parallel beta-helix repeat protein